MDVDITWFFTTCHDPSQYSPSTEGCVGGEFRRAWHEAMEKVMRAPLLTTESELEAARKYFMNTGEWSPEEVRWWSGDEVQAMLIQTIASQMRECRIGAYSTDEDWARYGEDVSDGRYPSNIYRGHDDRIYFDFGGD